MNPPKKNQTLFIIAAVVVVLGLIAYFVWLRPEATPNVSTSESSVTTEAQQTFLTLAAQLGPVAFDVSFLRDPRFLSLVDLKTAILPEPEGRTDPFGPLGQ